MNAEWSPAEKTTPFELFDSHVFTEHNVEHYILCLGGITVACTGLVAPVMVWSWLGVACVNVRQVYCDL